MVMTLPRIERKKQEHEKVKKKLSVTVKYTPLNEPAMLQFNAGFARPKEMNEPLRKEISFYHDKEFWNESEIYNQVMFRARSMAAGVPAIEMNGDYTGPPHLAPKIIAHLYSLKGKSGLHAARTIKEGKDFTISIEGVTAYEYESDEAFSWDEVKPLES